MDVARELARHLRGDPLLARYQNHLRAGMPEARNTEPWHALGERVQAALAIALAADDKIESFPVSLPPTDLIAMAHSVLRSHPYLWSKDMEITAIASPLPRHVIVAEGLMPFPEIFVSFEVSCDVTSLEGEPLGGRDWTWLQARSDGVLICQGVGRQGGGMLTFGKLMYGLTFPDDITEVERDGVGRILRYLAFLASPYVETDDQLAPRPIRREIERHKSPTSSPQDRASVVRLRRMPTPATPTTTSDPRERQSHWWVTGHYRAQWHPSLQGHQVKWIAPYLKGNRDMPLKERVYSVAR